MEPVLAQVYDMQGFQDAIGSFVREPNGGIVVPGDTFMQASRDVMIALAARHKVPAIYALRSNVEAGGLLSFSADYPAQYGGAAGYIDRLLKGAKVSELPVQQPVKYELVINLRTAKALGIEIPPAVLALADEVIE